MNFWQEPCFETIISSTRLLNYYFNNSFLICWPDLNIIVFLMSWEHWMKQWQYWKLLNILLEHARTRYRLHRLERFFFLGINRTLLLIEAKSGISGKEKRLRILFFFCCIRVKRTPATSPIQHRIKLTIFLLFSGLNFQDLMVRQGAIDSPPKCPFILGFECAGEIEQIGEGVEGFAVSKTCYRVSKNYLIVIQIDKYSSG